MGRHVWLSWARADTMAILFVTNDLVQRSPDRFIEGVNRNKQGQPVSPEFCANKIWGESDLPDYETRTLSQKPLPDLFEANGQWIVSGRATDVLCQFNLGDGALHPVTEGVYLRDQITKIQADFSTWIFGNSKQAFLPDKTAKKIPFGVSGQRWNMPDDPKDDDVAVSVAALDGADVWIDPGLFKAIFLSSALGDALVRAGLSKAFRLTRCRVC